MNATGDLIAISGTKIAFEKEEPILTDTSAQIVRWRLLSSVATLISRSSVMLTASQNSLRALFGLGGLWRLVVAVVLRPHLHLVDEAAEVLDGDLAVVVDVDLVEQLLPKKGIPEQTLRASYPLSEPNGNLGPASVGAGGA